MTGDRLNSERHHEGQVPVVADHVQNSLLGLGEDAVGGGALLAGEKALQNPGSGKVDHGLEDEDGAQAMSEDGP